MMEESMWYYLQDGQQAGPVAKDQLLSLFQQQVLAPDNSVWCAGMEQWMPANTVPGFFPEGSPGAAVYAPAGYMPTRPPSVTVLGILCLVFGGLGLICTPIGLAAMFIPNPHGGVQTYNPPAMQAFMMVSIFLGVIFSIVELAAGIGLLNLKRWARVTALIYGWTAIAWGILGTILNILIVIPSIREMGPEGSPEAVGGMIGGTIGGMCGGIIGLIFPIFLVIYMVKPHVVAACSK